MRGVAIYSYCERSLSSLIAYILAVHALQSSPDKLIMHVVGSLILRLLFPKMPATLRAFFIKNCNALIFCKSPLPTQIPLATMG